MIYPADYGFLNSFSSRAFQTDDIEYKIIDFNVLNTNVLRYEAPNTTPKYTKNETNIQ